MIRYVLMVLSTLVISCGLSSPLSDVILSEGDAGNLQVVIRLERIESYSFLSNRDRIVARIYDKNYALVRLKDGGITVNNVPMQEHEDIPDGVMYLLSPAQLKFVADSTYSFVITLGDSSEFTASIKTKPVLLDSVTIPGSHKRTDSLTIPWYPSNTAEIIHTVRYHRFDSTRTDTKKDSVSVAGLPDSYTYPASFFANNGAGVLNQVEFTIKSDTTGVIDSRFKSNSRIQAVSEIIKKTVVTD